MSLLKKNQEINFIDFLQIQEFGVNQVRELKPGGQNLPVTEENKKEYVKLVCQEKMTGAYTRVLTCAIHVHVYVN